MPKAAVLPLPVGALAKTSRPARATGIAACCMGVASVYLKSSMPRNSAAFRGNSEKIEMIAYLSVWRNLSTTRKIALEDEKECLTDSSSITASKPAANRKGCAPAHDLLQRLLSEARYLV
jgi:hypothetical protein